MWDRLIAKIRVHWHGINAFPKLLYFIKFNKNFDSIKLISKCTEQVKFIFCTWKGRDSYISEPTVCLIKSVSKRKWTVTHHKHNNSWLTADNHFIYLNVMWQFKTVIKKTSWKQGLDWKSQLFKKMSKSKTRLPFFSLMHPVVSGGAVAITCTEKSMPVIIIQPNVSS